MDLISIVFIFTAGMLSFLNPCSYPMLPSYVSYYIAREDTLKNKISVELVALNGIFSGLVTTLGFILVFGLFGILIITIGQGLMQFAPIFVPFTGVVLLLLGILMFTNISLSFAVPLKSPMQKGLIGLFFFGIIYALAAIGCAFPIFLTVVTVALTSGPVSGFLTFLIYALGMGSLMVPIALLIATSKSLVLKYIESLIPHIKKISGIILILMGIYQFYYYFAILR
ncbi:MAG: hypothetical protein HY929_00505 [Euryarchaeota archaeon]|nr:hypothetical protein [Euryarchaeota archaeon]